MIDINTVLLILIAHYVADFLMQSYETGQKKSSNWQVLLMHTIIYSLYMSIIILIYIKASGDQITTEIMLNTVLFGLITFIFHTLTDYITSRKSKALMAKKENKKALNLLGFDQLLHYVQLFITFKYLFL